jgi:hypothetical protein
MRAFAGILDGVFWPLRKLHEAITKMMKRTTKETEDGQPQPGN